MSQKRKAPGKSEEQSQSQSQPKGKTKKKKPADNANAAKADAARANLAKVAASDAFDVCPVDAEFKEWFDEFYAATVDEHPDFVKIKDHVCHGSKLKLQFHKFEPDRDGEFDPNCPLGAKSVGSATQPLSLAKLQKAIAKSATELRLNGKMCYGLRLLPNGDLAVLVDR